MFFHIIVAEIGGLADTELGTRQRIVFTAGLLKLADQYLVLPGGYIALYNQPFAVRADKYLFKSDAITNTA